MMGMVPESKLDKGMHFFLADILAGVASHRRNNKRFSCIRTLNVGLRASPSLGPATFH